MRGLLLISIKKGSGGVLSSAMVCAQALVAEAILSSIRKNRSLGINRVRGACTVVKVSLCFLAEINFGLMNRDWFFGGKISDPKTLLSPVSPGMTPQ